MPIPFLHITVFITGSVILMLEVLGSRVMGPFFGISLYIWASLITITLIALSLGYWLGGRIADKKNTPTLLYRIILFSSLMILSIPSIASPIMEWSYNFLRIKGGVLLSAFLIFSMPLILLGMVSPYTIRLLITENGSVGRVVGSIFAISTLGSVTGALVTAYILIPKLGVDKSLILGATLLLLISSLSFIIKRRYYSLLVTLLILVISSFLLLFYQRTHAENGKRKVIYKTDTFYGQLKVIDLLDLDIRGVLIDGSLQNIVYLIDQSYPTATGYVKLFTELLPTYQTGGGNALIIGLGAGEVPKLVLKLGYQSDIVEIDPKVETIARKYFNFNDKFGRVIIDDGRRYIRTCNKKYDFIFIDVALGGTQPWHFFTKETFQEMARILRPSGLIGVNLIGFYQGEKSKAAQSINHTLRTIYKDSNIYAIRSFNPEGLTNLVFFASNEVFSENPGRERILSNLNSIKIDYNPKDGTTLTDNYNPLDVWSIEVNEAFRKEMFRWLGVKLLR